MHNPKIITKAHNITPAFIMEIPTKQSTKKEGAFGGKIDANDHEPLLKENTNRFVLFPIQYDDVSKRDDHLACSAVFSTNLG